MSRAPRAHARGGDVQPVRFAALDDFTRQRLDDELIALWRARGFAVVFVTHSVTEAVYLSADAGATWTRLDVKEPLRPNDQLTCVALSPHGSAVAVGTSFHGFFETSDRGAHWIDLSEKIAAMQLGGGNYEEVASVAYSPVDPDLVPRGYPLPPGSLSLLESPYFVLVFPWNGDPS